MERSHASFLAEFREAGEDVVPWIVAEVGDDFVEYVRRLHAASDGSGIPAGFVAHSTYWLVDPSEEIVAISNLRHELNDFLLTYGGHIGFGVRPSARGNGYATEVLRQTLLKARSRGIERVRVTCARSNVASARTILRNGGQLDDEEYMPDHGQVVCRYWIDLGSLQMADRASGAQ